MKPTPETILNNILPALKKALDSTEQRDIVSSCMIAMAKVGQDHPDFKLSSVFAPRLKSRDLETQETAALSFGIAALKDAENVKMLIALAKDTPEGRSATGSSEINDRTRAFATYGLGLLAYQHSDPDLKKQIFESLKGLLADDKMSSRNLKIAVVNAIGLLHIGIEGGADADPLMNDAIKALTDYYTKDLGAGEQLMQSHCPPAIAKLLGRDTGKLATESKKLFALDLSGRSKLKRSSDDIYRACALALGVMCQPYEEAKDKAPDADYSRLLLDTFHNHKDLQTKYFAVLALGQIGGKENHDTLIKEFDKAKKMEKPWCAIAMGVYAFHKYDAAEKAGGSADLEKAFGETLRAALKDEKSPNPLGGIAVGLGLCRFKEASDDLRAKLMSTKEEELAGYLCIGLALMDEKRAVEDINTVVKQSLRKPKLLQQAAIALGKLGDKDVAETLQQMLGEDDRNLAKLSAIASALGFIGDARTIEPLKKMLFDDSLTDLSRAFAGVALGGVGDKEDLPWNSKIGSNMNYRASAETLTGSVRASSTSCSRVRRAARAGRCAGRISPRCMYRWHAPCLRRVPSSHAPFAVHEGALMSVAKFRAAHLCAALFLLGPTLLAHGGQYVGPPDLVPPTPGARGGRATGPVTPPGPDHPVTPGPLPPRGTPPVTGPKHPVTGRPPSPAASSPTTGIPIETDVTSWDVWWEINKAPYLRLKDAVRAGGVATGSADFYLGPTTSDTGRDLVLPTEHDSLDVILPALHRAITSSGNRDITSACMVAMAKIGRDHPTFTLASVFPPQLASHDQEIRETAALSIGIAALPSAANLDLLVALATDTAAGRRSCRNREVDDRTRSFAIYGLGLVGHSCSDTAVKRAIAECAAAAARRRCAFAAATSASPRCRRSDCCSRAPARTTTGSAPNCSPGSPTTWTAVPAMGMTADCRPTVRPRSRACCRAATRARGLRAAFRRGPGRRSNRRTSAASI